MNEVHLRNYRLCRPGTSKVHETRRQLAAVLDSIAPEAIWRRNMPVNPAVQDLAEAVRKLSKAVELIAEKQGDSQAAQLAKSARSRTKSHRAAA